MIKKTQGIVLSHIPFKETSIIARIYTRDFGYQAYIVNSIRSARSKQGLGFFQPFTQLDLVVYMKENRDLHRLSEYHSIGLVSNHSLIKQTVLLFLAEVVEKLLRNDHSENTELFDFVRSSLDTYYSHESLPNFHLQFLLHMTPYLGLSAISGSELFENMNRVSGHQEIESFIEQLIHADLKDNIDASGDLRRRALDSLIQYFQHHLDGFGRIHSLKVLSQIFR